MYTFDGVHIMMSQQFKTEVLDEPEARERERVHEPILKLRQYEHIKQVDSFICLAQSHSPPLSPPVWRRHSAQTAAS